MLNDCRVRRCPDCLLALDPDEICWCDDMADGIASAIIARDVPAFRAAKARARMADMPRHRREAFRNLIKTKVRRAAT